MKKIIRIVFTLLIAFVMTIQVSAMRYEFRDLMPSDKTVTLRGDIFLYKDMKLKNNEIEFRTIKNLSKENHAVTISLAFFDNKKENIGIINYCSTSDALSSKNEVLDYSIKIKSENLAENKNIKDIKYISVLSENSNCRLGGSKEYIGKKIEDINMIGNGELSSSTKLLINILKILAIILFIVFMYKYLFTSAYQNIDGEDTRRYYKNKTKKHKNNNENLKPNNNTKTYKHTKSKNIMEQELHENDNANKDNSDLHKFYKD